MQHLFDDRRFRALVMWCGVWEAGHLWQNLETTFGATDFPPPPAGGWAAQTRLIFDGIVASDLIQAALCLVFVGGVFARRSWSLVLGLICLGSSAFNSYAFTRFMIGTGAWAEHALEYSLIQVSWAPLFGLFVWLAVALSRELQRGASAPHARRGTGASAEVWRGAADATRIN